jgi:site-specific DNA-methyltransferase (adenine-specific)
MESEVVSKPQLILGDCLDRLKELPDNSVDAIITDPPYGLEFMGKEWDSFGTKDGFRRKNNANDAGRDSAFGRLSQKGPEYCTGANAFQGYMTPIFVECRRVLKPGGHLLAFGGSRTYHRLASAVEDAGFEIRDQIMWLYGQGFPKSKNLDGDWAGWGTALKPAHEPIVVGRKPLQGTVAANVLEYGVGALNIDGCRVVRASDDRFEYGVDGDEKPTTGASGIYGKYTAVTPYEPHPQGRWPANVIHDGSDEVLSEFAKYGEKGNGWKKNYGEKDYKGLQYGGGSFGGGGYLGGSTYCDSGTAARFFYCAKANRKDRGDGNNHPTVKPTELMRYLIRLVTPPGGTVLDPFMGSGSTGKAAALDGFHFIGIEKERAYFDIAKQRVDAEFALAV